MVAQKKTFLITAGPTQEALDPVRYLSNHSSGKMGYALAEAAKKAGHRVILISGPTNLEVPKGVKLISVTSAREMHKTVFDHYKSVDVILKVAAVADYRPVRQSKFKIKKGNNSMTVKFVRNPDILKELGQKKLENQILVGFAAETNFRYRHAHKKLREKNCDWIILNNVSKKGIGFQSDKNQATLFSKAGDMLALGVLSKKALASKIIKTVLG